MRNEVRAGTQFFPRRPRGGSIEIWIEQHLQTQTRSILCSLLSYPCCQETTCAITSNRDPPGVCTNVERVISDPYKSGPSIIVRGGGKGFRRKTAHPRNNEELGHICQRPQYTVFAFNSSFVQ